VPLSIYAQGEVLQGATRSLGVVILPPVGNDLTSMGQTPEPVEIEALVAESPVEAVNAVKKPDLVQLRWWTQTCAMISQTRAAQGRELCMGSQDRQDINKICVRRSLAKAMACLVASLLILALFGLSVLLLTTSVSFTDGAQAGGPTLVLVGVALGAIMAIVAGIFFSRQLLSSGYVLVIDSEGITDRCSLFRLGTIRWDEISALIWTKGALIIIPRDIRSILVRQHPVSRVLLTITVHIIRFPNFRYPIFIPAPLLSESMRSIRIQVMATYSGTMVEHGILVERR
jgi:hypothetical protein